MRGRRRLPTAPHRKPVLAAPALLPHPPTSSPLHLPEIHTGQGVTAWMQRPVQRERPNERFLQHTLRSVHAHNRRAQEEEMWERYQQRQQREEEQTEERPRRRDGDRRERRQSRSHSRSRSRSHSRSEGRRRPSRSNSRSRSPRSSRRRERRRGRSVSRSRSRSRSRSPGKAAGNQSPHPAGGSSEQQAAAAAADEEEGAEGYLSDDAIAAMIATKRSRCGGVEGWALSAPCVGLR